MLPGAVPDGKYHSNFLPLRHTNGVSFGDSKCVVDTKYDRKLESNGNWVANSGA